MNDSPRNFMSGKSHGPSLAIVIGKSKEEEPHDERTEQGESAGYSESGPANCGKCSHFKYNHCDEEHMNQDPAVQKDDKGAVVNGETGFCHFFDAHGPQGKDSMMKDSQMMEEETEKEHNYPERFSY